ncbi:Hypothetical_protein [Hexamita inflata]|uniref:Hypothetical_protein n=1 Tax=Hexamita inflata TaxID=28002 RepID=A0AA86QS82_9EUKA|nr:Hypothetical protein HINF_LOCUS48236 [Hexamita inflata]
MLANYQNTKYYQQYLENSTKINNLELKVTQFQLINQRNTNQYLQNQVLQQTEFNQLLFSELDNKCEQLSTQITCSQNLEIQKSELQLQNVQIYNIVQNQKEELNSMIQTIQLKDQRILELENEMLQLNNQQIQIKYNNQKNEEKIYNKIIPDTQQQQQQTPQLIDQNYIQKSQKSFLSQTGSQKSFAVAIEVPINQNIEPQSLLNEKSNSEQISTLNDLLEGLLAFENQSHQSLLSEQNDSQSASNQQPSEMNLPAKSSTQIQSQPESTASVHKKKKTMKSIKDSQIW